MKKFNVGLQLYGVRNSMKEDFEGTLKAVSEMGYEYVEFAGYYGKTSDEIKDLLNKYGLKCVSVHQVIDIFDEKSTLWKNRRSLNKLKHNVVIFFSGYRSVSNAKLIIVLMSKCKNAQFIKIGKISQYMDKYITDLLE